jgi:hypothetical protein
VIHEQINWQAHHIFQIVFWLIWSLCEVGCSFTSPFQCSNPRIRFTESELICDDSYIIWAQISKRFRICSQNFQILTVWPTKAIFVKNNVGKT